MAPIENVCEVTDAVAPMFRNGYDRRRNLSRATRVERCEILRDSHLMQNLKDGSVSETVEIPVPCFEHLLWCVVDSGYDGHNRGDEPLPAMEKVHNGSPVHNGILRQKKAAIDRTDTNSMLFFIVCRR